MADLSEIFGPEGFDPALHIQYTPAFDRYAAIAAFTKEIEAHGALVAGYAVANGEIQRVKHIDDKARSKNFWYVLYESPDFISGCFGHWKDPYSRTSWSSFNPDEMTHQQRQDYATTLEEAKARQEAERKRIHDEVAAQCTEEWTSYQDAPETHHYFITKQVKPVPGVKWDGGVNLVVPLINEAGQIRTLQRINYDGGKLFPAGGEKRGCFFLIQGSDTLILTAEGLATAISLHMASGATVYVAFDAGNLPLVTEIARRRHPGVKLIVCADNDRFTRINGELKNIGLLAANKAAQAAGPGTLVACPNFLDTDTESSDFNDLHARYGLESVNKQVGLGTQGTEYPMFDTKPVYGALTAHEFISAQKLVGGYAPAKSIVKRFINQDNVGFLIAAPGSLKTFIALDCAFCVTTGNDWAGRKTKSGVVVYLAGEGYGGLVPRLKALEIKYGVPVSNKLIVSKLPADLLNAESASSVVNGIFNSCQEIGELPSLVIVDTFHRNTSGDENSASDFGQLLKNLDMQFRACLPGISFLFIHHTGHDNNGRGRGTSAIKASCDTEWLASRDGDTVTLSCAKFKDGAEPPNISFKTVEVDTGFRDEDGEPITSLYLDYIEGEAETKTKGKKKRLGKRDDAILTALDRAIAEHGIAPSAELRARFGGFDGNIGQSRKVVHIDHWRNQAYPVIDSEGEKLNKRQAFQRSRNKLIELDIVQQFEDCWWRIDW